MADKSYKWVKFAVMARYRQGIHVVVELGITSQNSSVAVDRCIQIAIMKDVVPARRIQVYKDVVVHKIRP